MDNETNDTKAWSKAINDIRTTVLLDMDNLGDKDNWNNQEFTEYVFEILAHLEFAKIAADRAGRLKFKVEHLK